MANSGLIVFLPVISAFVGAIIGAWANSWYRNRETKKARKQELEGLLILLSTEVRTNNLALESFLKETSARPDSDKRTIFADHLHSSVWDESNARLAQLLPRTSDVATVALYYMVLINLRYASTGARGQVPEGYTEAGRSQRQAGTGVLKMAQRYISDSDLAKILAG